jgi:nitroreductase
MLHNPIIDAMLKRKSIRKYTDRKPSDETITTVVRAGMQAPFAAQLYSVLLSRDKENNTWNAPLEFVICVDVHKMETIMAKRHWRMASNDLMLLIFGIQDAILLAENLVMAAESLGLGSCFLGSAPTLANRIAEKFALPERVFPVVGLVMGYPAEDPPPRPRYPIDFVLFEDKYPEFTDELVERAMKEMDEGYLAQNYYRNINYRVELEDGKEDKHTFDNYSWTEHHSRKCGQWHKSPEPLLDQLAKRGFDLRFADSKSPEE